MAGEGVEFGALGARGGDEAAQSWAGRERGGFVGMRCANRAFEAVDGDCLREFVVGYEGSGLSIELLGVGTLFFVQRPQELKCIVSHLVDG